jgi:hypothetical protein
MRSDGCDEPGYRDFVEHGRRIWETSERTFFAGPMASPLTLARRMRSPFDLARIDPLRTLDAIHLATYQSVITGAIFTKDKRVHAAAKLLGFATVE